MIRRVLALVAVVAALWGIPRLSHPATDIGRLEPVKAVRLTVQQGIVRLETDTGAFGTGITLEEAVENLRKAETDEVFLDTADYLLVSGNLSEHWQVVFALFRPTCQVCAAEGEMDLAEAAEYLDMHSPEQTLGQIRGGIQNWKILRMEEGRGQLEPG